VQDIIKPYSQFINEAKAIKDLSSRDEKPMVKGIAQILRGVKDKENRQSLADKQVKQFKKEGITFDYVEFFKLCGL
jgi:predicted TIM-barrel fold metal-dependent hydrolase